MKALTLISTLAAAAVMTLPSMASASGINDRQHDQRHRIANGYKSESLTRHETANLARQQARIQAFEFKNRVDGNGYTAKERARTQHRLDEANKDIYRKKHNDRDRGRC